VIPGEALLTIDAFDPAGYVELEQAVHSYRVNSLVRQSQDRFFTLDGMAGYAWQGGTAAGTVGTGGSAGAAGSSVSAGAGISLGGIQVSAGISLPVEKPWEPSLTIALQWASPALKVFDIDRRLRGLAEVREVAALAEAEDKFRSLEAEYRQRRADLEWQRETYDEELDLYRRNAEEQRLWFDRGIIRETDYLDAQTDYLLAANRVLAAGIDRRLYNLELRALFVPALFVPGAKDGD
jgi:hypothetical protein